MVVHPLRGHRHARRLRPDEARRVPGGHGADPLHAVPHLADQGGPRLGNARPGDRVQQPARRLPRALVLLGHRAADRPDHPRRRLLRRLRRRRARSRAGGRPTSRPVSSRATSSGTRTRRSASRSRRRRRTEANGLCTLPDGSLGVYTDQPETRWKLRLDHVSDDLPFGFRGVLSIRDYSDQQYLQDFERSFCAQLRAPDRLARLPDEEPRRRLAQRPLRAERDLLLLDRHPGAVSVGRVLPPHRPDRAQPLLPLAPVLAVRPLHEPRPGLHARHLRPVRRVSHRLVPLQGNSLALAHGAGGRPRHAVHGLGPGSRRPFTGEAFTRAYGEGGVSFVGPSFSRIYDTTIGPWDKFKHVIEPRVDYQYVSNVDDPDHIPAFDEIDNALGRNQVRYAIVNRLLARAAGVKGSAEEIASLEIAQTYAFEFPQTLVPLPPSFAAAQDRAPTRGSSASRSRGSSTSTAGWPTTPTPTSSRTRASRPAPTGAPTTSTSAGSAARPVVDDARPVLQLRPVPLLRGRRPRQVFPVRRVGRLRRADEHRPGGPGASDLQGLLLHRLSGGPAAAPAAGAAQRLPARRQPQGHRDDPRRQRLDRRAARVLAGGRLPATGRGFGMIPPQ